MNNKLITNNYLPIIGLEIHIEPNTASKMFCGCPQEHFGKQPNSQTCPICMGLPGALPFANRSAVEKTILLGLALKSEINTFSNFYRKHYFYPDLPKGFQTSQKNNPLCLGGSLIGFELDHIHLEEDAGKLVHETINGDKVSLVDFNRSGCALIELVTKPVFHDTESVLEFVKELQLIARYLNISGADMEKGTMRLEANVSLLEPKNLETKCQRKERIEKQESKKQYFELPNYKVELKNINSFKFLVNAINAEIERQKEILSKSLKPKQETRGYDEVKKTTFSQRSKEESQDYRYFPEADLPPMVFDIKDIKFVKSLLTELPEEKRKRFNEIYKIPNNFIEILVSDKILADYFEEAAKYDSNYKTIADFIVNKKLHLRYPEPAGFIKKLKSLQNAEYANPEEMTNAIEKIISENQKAVGDFSKGNTNVIGFLIGQAQKVLKGKGNPGIMREKILIKLQEEKK